MLQLYTEEVGCTYGARVWRRYMRYVFGWARVGFVVGAGRFKQRAERASARRGLCDYDIHVSA